MIRLPRAAIRLDVQNLLYNRQLISIYFPLINMEVSLFFSSTRFSEPMALTFWALWSREINSHLEISTTK